MDIVVIFFFDSLKNVLKRGFYQEFVMTVKQTCLITLCSVFYLFTFKEAENYSRLVLGYTAALYLLLSYVLRCLWKNCLRKYFGGAEKRSLLIVTVSDIVDTVIDNIKNKNYGDYFVTGVCILDKKAKGRVIDGVTVVADEDDLVEYVCREWVDEVFINIPESEPYPAELLDKFIEMGVVVHMKLAKSQNLLGKKQFVEHLGTYTVLTTSINSVSRRQIILKRMMDIAGGLAGCIITGILCIFVGPAIYIQSPGPIFFKQTRVGKNGKMFQMYKFRSMYMDAEERKAELMKENRVQDGMMFKLDFDPRIIGSKKLPDGTIKKGVGNFIRDWSLDEFPQFLNVLKGDMSLVGTRPPTVDEWDKYELHHRARLATKPGLTGMWQVSGRSNITDLKEKNQGFASCWSLNHLAVSQIRASFVLGLYLFLLNAKIVYAALYVREFNSERKWQIASTSVMLHLFVYEIPEKKDYKLLLSNLSRLIPSDFYGNRVSTKPECLFKSWKKQYQKYNQNSNDALKKYHTSLEYKYEVTLDLENFFPTINPKELCSSN